MTIVCKFFFCGVHSLCLVVDTHWYVLEILLQMAQVLSFLLLSSLNDMEGVKEGYLSYHCKCPNAKVRPFR